MTGKKVLLIFVMVIGIALLTWGSIVAKPKPPVDVNMGEVTEVTMVDPFNLSGSGGVINIAGIGFGEDYAPSVSLGEFEDLVIILYSDTGISARSPAGLVPGDYMLSITPYGNPQLTIEYPLTVGPETVPSGLIAFFPASDCPLGWTEVTGARGRVVVGLPAAGTVNGTVGTELSDLENRSHAHDLNLSAGATGAAGSHNHTGLTSITEHTHSEDFVSAPTTTRLADYDDTYRVSVADLDHTHTIESSGAHGHLIQADTGHTHSIGGTSSTSTDTSAAMPYLQLLACEKD